MKTTKTKYTNGTLSFYDYKYFENYMDTAYGFDLWFINPTNDEYLFYNKEFYDGDIDNTGWYRIQEESSDVSIVRYDGNVQYLKDVCTEATVSDMKKYFDDLEKAGYGARQISICGMTRFYSYLPERTKSPEDDYLILDTENDLDINIS